MQAARRFRLRPALLALTVGFLSLTSSAAAAGPGVSVSGPLTNLTLCQPYSYTASVTPSKSYHDATIILFAYGSTEVRLYKNAHLVAGRKWTGHFTVYFNRPEEMTAHGLMSVLMVLPPHHGYTVLSRRHYSLTPAPGQTPQPIGPECGPVPKYFGS